MLSRKKKKEPVVDRSKDQRRPQARSHLKNAALSLEQRLMFDAAAAATASEVASEQVAQEQAEAAVSSEAAGDGRTTEQHESQEFLQAIATYNPGESTTEIAFVDPTVPDYKELITGMGPNVEVVMLDATGDGIEQIAESLAGRSGIDAIHLLSHGNSGELQLGTGTLNAESMASEYADELSTIRSALSEQADLLVYGCNFGEGVAGGDAVNLLAELTGADVAASSDATGHIDLGGDWEFEVQAGSIETDLAVTDTAQMNWAGILGAETVSDTFSAESYSNNNGTQSWSTSWSETDSSGGGASGGDVRVNSSQLRIDADTVGNAISRGVNLSGATSATLTFDYTNALLGADRIEVRVSTDGGANYQTLTGGIFSSAANTGSGTASLDLSSYMSANTRIQFIVTGSGGDERLYVDNVQISYQTNSAPTITSNGGGATASANVAENNSTVTTVTATDADAGATLTYSISGGADAAKFSINSSTGALSFTSAPNYESPTDSGGNNVYDVTVQVSDGIGGTDSQAISVTVTDIDAAVNVVPGTQTTSEDTSLVFSSGNGNQIAINDDAGGNAVEVTVSVTNGTLILAGTTGLTFTTGDGTTDTTMTFRGTVADINTALNGVSYSPTADYAGGAVLTISTTDSTLVSLNLDANLQARYTFSGNANDVAPGTAQSGTLIGNATIVNDATRGQVLSLDGADDYVNLTTHTGTFSTLSQGTLSAWVNLTATGERTIFDIGDGAAEQNFVSLFVNNGKVELMIMDGGTVVLDTVSTVSVNDGNWHHVAFTVDGSGNQLYIDGAAAARTFNAGSSATATFISSLNSTTNTTIGAYNNGAINGEFLGRLDEVCVYNRALSGSEVGTLAGDLSLTDTDTVAITVNPVNDAPTDLSLSANTVVENAANGTVVGTVSGVDPDSGDTKSYSLTDTAGGRFAINSSTGVITVADGSLLNYEAATSHSVTVRVTDSGGLTYDETFAINLTNVAEAPIANDDSASGNEDSAITGNVLANDTDGDGDALTASLVSGPSHGSLTLNADGSYSYTPDTNWNGTDSFQYLVNDGSGLTHYWGLEGNGTDTVGGANGTLMNDPTTITGQDGTALQFDGVNDYVALPDLTYTNEFSLSFSFQVADNSGTGIQYFYSHGAVGVQNAIHVSLVETSYSNASVRNNLVTTVWDSNDPASGQVNVDISGLIGDGQWHTYAMSVTDAGGTEVYVDGVLRGSMARGGDAINPTGNAYLGARSDLDPTRFLNAGSCMDSVALFNRALTSSEITNLATNPMQATVTLTVNPVNDAPVLTPQAPDVTFVEGGLAQVIDATGTVADVDSANFDGGVLSVSISANGTVDDRLMVGNWGTGPGQVGVSGSTVTYEGTVIGTVSGGTSGSDPLTVTFNTSATSAAVQEVYRSIQFNNVSDDPSTATRTLAIGLTDGDGGTATPQTKLVYVQGSNDAPNDLSLSANTVAENAANGTVVGTVSGTDPDSGDTKSYSLTDTAGGRFAINSSTGVITVADGSLLNYENATNHSVTVRVTDSGGLAYDETFTINLTNVNEAPTGADATVTINEDTAHTLTTANFGFSDVDVGDSLSAVRIDSLPTAGSLTLSGVAITAGQVVSVADITAGNLVFTPAANAIGSGYASLTFSVRDSSNAYDTAPNTLAVDVTAVNDAPTDLSLSANTVAENAANGTVVGSVTGTDVDTGDTKTYSLTDTAGGRFAINSTTGQISVADGSLLNYEAATSHTVTVRVTDAGGLTYDEAFTINLTNVNEAPTGADATVTITEDTAQPLTTGNFGFSDVDAGDSLSAVRIDTIPTAGTLTLSGVAVTAGQVVTVADITAGNLVFTPAANATGSGYASLTFSVRDSNNAYDAAPNTLTVDVTGQNDAPVNTVPGAQSVAEDTPLSLSGVSVTDVDGNLSTVQLGVLNGTVSVTLAGGATISAGSNGTTTLTLSGSQADINATLATLVYQGTLNFTGADTLTVTSTDANSGTDVDTVALTVTAVDDATVVTGGTSGTGTEDTTLTGTLTATDVEGLSDGTVFSVTGAASNGTASIDPATGLWSYTPTADYNGSDSFTVTITDDAGNTATQVISVTVTPVADITNDSLTTNEDTAISANVLTGTNGATADSFEGTPVLTSVTQGANGTVTFLANGTVTYTPTANFTGTDSFTYTITSGGVTETATVTVTVTAVNDPTVVTGGTSGSGNEDTTLTGTLTATDVEGLSDGSVFSVSTGATNGTASIDPATGLWSYTPTVDWNGSDSFTVTITDDAGNSSTQVITLTVTPVNDAPTDLALSANTVTENASNGTVVGTVTGTDVDTVDTKSYSLTDTAGGRFAINSSTGQITVADGSLLNYEAATNHSVTVRVTDAGGLTYDEALTINLTNVNEAPTAIALSGSTVAENSANGTVVGAASTTDVDAGDSHTYQLMSNAGGRFAIDSTTGVITVADGSLLNYEAATSHTVAIRTTDVGGLTHDQVLSIAVTDVHEATTTTTVPGPLLPRSSPPPTSTSTPPATSIPVDPGPVDGAALGPVPTPPVPPSDAAQSVSPPIAPRVSLSAIPALGPGHIQEGEKPVVLDDERDLVAWTFVEPVLNLLHEAADQLRTLAQSPEIPVKLSEFIVKELDAMTESLEQAMEGQQDEATLVAATAAGVSIVLSTGYVVWALRGGWLLASLLATMPAWRSFDPLPVLVRAKEDRERRGKHDDRREDERIEHLFGSEGGRAA